jgi:hypothetical protein
MAFVCSIPFGWFLSLLYILSSTAAPCVPFM